MKKIFAILFFVVSGFVFSQSGMKTTFISAENILKKIMPDQKIDSWTLVYNIYARDHIIKSQGKVNYLPQFKGFSIDSHSDGFYYIAYSEKGTISYVTDLQNLRYFAGTVDNPEEAAIIAIAEGFEIDFEFKDYAANYQNAGEDYLIEAGKVTSENCPLSKNHYMLSVNRKTGKISGVKDLGQYFEIYGKDCQNNPHHSAIKTQMEEAKLKAEEQKRIQKEMTDKMEKRIRKIQRKRR